MDHDIIDNNIKNVLRQLSEKSVSHPNITKMWREYIVKKVDKLNLTIRQCECAINMMNETADISQTNILALYNIVYLLNMDDDLNIVEH
jgi:hypothetical protein